MIESAAGSRCEARTTASRPCSTTKAATSLRNGSLPPPTQPRTSRPCAESRSYSAGRYRRGGRQGRPSVTSAVCLRLSILPFTVAFQQPLRAYESVIALPVSSLRRSSQTWLRSRGAFFLGQRPPPRLGNLYARAIDRLGRRPRALGLSRCEAPAHQGDHGVEVEALRDSSASVAPLRLSASSSSSRRSSLVVRFVLDRLDMAALSAPVHDQFGMGAEFRNGAHTPHLGLATRT
jgi:hypothetical protein